MLRYGRCNVVASGPQSTSALLVCACHTAIRRPIRPDAGMRAATAPDPGWRSSGKIAKIPARAAPTDLIASGPVNDGEHHGRCCWLRCSISWRGSRPALCAADDRERDSLMARISAMPVAARERVNTCLAVHRTPAFPTTPNAPAVGIRGYLMRASRTGRNTHLSHTLSGNTCARPAPVRALFFSMI